MDEGDSTDDEPGDDTEAPETKREGQVSKRPSGKLYREGRLDRGTTVGRYVVIDVLGEGGMGVVYAAFDPELDRKVAIKLLQANPAGGSASGGQAWLLREAQALARLAHPNVIAVHDVGTLSGDRVFVAMEHVDGSTLRAWLKDKPRSWREVRAVMLEAGAGLAAAHAAGLVHRDFKSENVLVGRDGRVRVMDFGLARLQAEAPASRSSDLDIEARSPLSETLTSAGSVVGTPAYMAPELHAGEPANPRSDQFAFGVTLFEALYRTRPFEKKQLLPPHETKPQPKKVDDSGVPARIHRVVLRALEIDPAARYASMDDLLRELAADPMAARRRVMLAAGAVAIAGAAVAGATMMSGSRDELCKGAERRLAGAWDVTTKQAVRDAFGASTRPFATRALDGLVRTLDGYSAEWTTAVTDSCRATRIRGDQTEEVQTLRQDCLDQRLEELRAFTQLLAKADDAIVEKAGTAALNLEPVKKCANVTALRAPTQPTPEIRPKVDAARARLADAKAGFLSGNLGRAINAGTEAAEAAKQIPFEPLLAESRLVLGMALIQVGNAPDAATALAEATWAGLRSKRDDVAALAAIHAALTVSEGLNKDGEAKLWLDLGRAASARVGVDRNLELKLLETEGIVAGNRGDLVAAAAAHDKALGIAKQLYGPDATVVARNHQLLAATLSRASDYAGAQPHYERAMALMESFVGSEHPDVALMLSGLGSCYHYTGAFEKSHAAFARSLAIRERVFGPNSPVLIPTLNNNAELLRDEGNHATGLPLAERAKTITDKTVGRGHPYFIIVNCTYGDLLALAGRTDEARAAIDEALAVAEKIKSAYLPEAQTTRAAFAVREQQWALAGELAEKAIIGFETKAGKDAGELWRPLTSLALAKINTGKAADAKPLLERAIAIGEKGKLPPSYLAPTRAALAALGKGG